MGHQIRFYLTDSDFEDLMAGLGAEVEFLCLPDRVGHAEGLQTPCKWERGLDLGALFVMVAPGNASSLRWTNLPGGLTKAVDVEVSPVIDVLRPAMKGQAMRYGRFWFSAEFADRAGTRQAKSREFVLWAKRILALAKRRLTLNREFSAYMGREAASKWKAGAIELCST